jgi:DNA-binding GntR family transcriptional regulator
VPAAAPLDRPSTGDLVAEHVRQLIFDGALRPGERIPVDAIAGDLGVSRLPVREALLGLARDGLVAMAPHQGAYVGPFDEEVVRDHFEIVGMVQGLAAARLAARGDAGVLEQLDTVVARLERTTDPATANELGIEFYRLINVDGGSARQRSVLRALGRMLPTGFFVDVPGSVESARTGATRVRAAIASGDEREIRRTCLAVQRERGDLVVDHLRARGVFAVPLATTSSPRPSRRRAGGTP